MEKQVKQLISFNFPKEIPEGYLGSSSMDYAFCSKQVNGKSTILSAFVNCRETLAGHMIAYYNNTLLGDRVNYKYYLSQINLKEAACLAMRHGKYKKTDNTKRLLLQYYDRSFRFSEHILNLLEEEVGFKRTTISPAKLLRPTTYQDPYYWRGNDLVSYHTYIEGDPRWVLSPQTISLYALLLRMPFSVPALNSKVVPKLKSFDQLITFLEKSSYSSFRRDRCYLVSARYWKPFLKNLGNIFYIVPKDNYLHKNYALKKEDAHVLPSQGFESLTSRHGRSQKINTAFEKYVMRNTAIETSAA